MVTNKTKYLNEGVYFRSTVDHAIFNPFPYKRLIGIGDTWMGFIENETSLGHSGVCISEFKIEFEYSDKGYHVHAYLSLYDNDKVDYYERVNIPGDNLKLPRMVKETIDNFRAWFNNNTHYGKSEKLEEKS